jgi:hypothetical protein
MSHANHENQRAQLLSLLWSLKRAVDSAPQGSVPGVHYVHFNALRNDESYRADLLGKAGQSEDEEIRALAREILAIEGSSGVAEGESAPREPAVSQVQGASGPSPSALAGKTDRIQPPAARRLSGTTTVAFALAAIGLVAAGYLATETRLLEKMSRVDVAGSIGQDTVWRSGSTYHLNGLVFVEGNATLSIEPGTRIVGQPGAALIVTRDAKLHARGSADEPIVFTSAKPEGQRARGDWGGVVLLGNAPVNTPISHIEGVDHKDPRGAFGGTDEAGSCGMLQYVRIEFAGFELSKDNELNGLTLGGCGTGTILRYVQVHMGEDDGIEIFGGGANLSNLVISRSGDDGLDWDRGWTGAAQFVVIQQDESKGDSGIEADNQKSKQDATPRSAPILSNVTIVGGGNPDVGQRGLVLRHGTAADLRNMLIAGFSLDAIDVRDASTVAQAKAGTLHGEALVFAEPAKGRVFEKEEGKDDDDGGFDEEAFFVTPKTRSVFIGERVLPQAAHSLTEPDFVPAWNESLMRVSAPIPQGEFWDEAANFVGAIRPGSRTTWLDGWTAFPSN